MNRTIALLVGVAFALTPIASLSDDSKTKTAPEPPCKRVLKDEDAAKVVELSKKIAEMEVADRYPEAVKAAEEMYAIRTRVQGLEHWETVVVKYQIEQLQKIGQLGAEQRGRWQQALQGFQKARQLVAKGQHAQALPLQEEWLKIGLEMFGKKHPLTANNYSDVATNLDAQRKYADAESLYQKALAIYRKLLGEEHPFTAKGYTNFATSLYKQAKYAEAEYPFQKALEINRKVRGEEHLETARCYGDVGNLLNAQRKYKAAEPFYQKALTVRIKVLGERDLLIAKSFYVAALNLNAQGKFADAEPFLQKALTINRELVGDENGLTAVSYREVAISLNSQRKYAEAQPLFEKALAIFRKLEGEGPSAAQISTHLGMNLNSQSKFGEAEPHFRKALEIARRVLGEKNSLTAQSYHDVATNLYFQRNYQEAEPFFQKALAIYRTVLGEEHPQTTNCYNNFANNLNAQGKLADAEPMFQKVLETYRKAPGEEHLQTADAYGNVAANLNNQGRYAEADPYLQKALAIRRKILGDRDLGIARIYIDVANNLNAQGKYWEAAPIYEKALAIRREALGEKHLNTAAAYGSLAINLRDQGKHAEVETIFQKVLAIYREMGEDNLSTAAAYLNVAINLNDRGKYAEAEPIYQKALTIYRKVLSDENPTTANCYHSVAANLLDAGKYGEAQPYCDKALAIRRKLLSEKHELTGMSYTLIAANLYNQGKYADAERNLHQAIATYEAARLAVGARGFDRSALGAVQSPYSLLAHIMARSERAAAAWMAQENDLARGLLDEMTGTADARLTREETQRRQDLVSRLNELQPRLMALVIQSERTRDEQKELTALQARRAEISSQLSVRAAALSKGAVATLPQLQSALSPHAALVVWLDVADRSGGIQEHWVCVVRNTGQPKWERLPGSGSDRKWSSDDGTLAGRLRDELAKPVPSPAIIVDFAKQLHAQRLAPTEKHLQGITHLYAVPVNEMAGIPIEALTDKYTISYVPSGTFLARLKDKPASNGSGILALGDPIFKRPTEKPSDTALPPGGLLIRNVVPGSPGAKAGLRDGDVLLSYAGTELTSVDQLQKLMESNAGAESVESKIWRGSETNKINTRDVPPGKLGITLDKRPAPEAIADRRKTDGLLSALRGPDLAELPGTRIEVNNLAKLFAKNATVLVDSDASEQKLEELRTNGALSKFRYLHFGTHGAANNVKSFESILYLSKDKLPKELVSEPGKPFINGELSAREVLEYWKLDAELVTLSACETALGRHGGGDGLLGFAQAFLTAGSRSVCLSLWKVDDCATSLLMDRFYQNLLGKREGLSKPMPKSEALNEAKTWLRNLSYDEALKFTTLLSGGASRGPRAPGAKIDLVVTKDPKTEMPAKDFKPFTHPKYWAAFILIGDPN